MDKNRPQMATHRQKRKTLVLPLQETFEEAPSKTQDFPDPSPQTLQARDAPRKAIFGENWSAVPGF